MPVPKGVRIGGRQKGTSNKATADLKKIAQKHTASSINELARLATKAESEQARVAAIRELLDRGHGKPTQAIDANLTGNLTINVVKKTYPVR